MKKLNYITVGFLIIIGFTGCAGSWKQINKDSPNKIMLNKALNECKFEEQRKIAKSYILKSYSGNAVYKERMRQNGDKVYKDALSCMKTKGFTN
ncbi:hypothetical protein [Sulfurimonas sp.]|uniref:hypothetical protein n=1 Tax=Sulfurimonas sp. TaxID=2022749 RepID=UPI002B45F2C9|nr:hypothetical protein [Sulfurimonas sp.]